ncbi:MAG TPA: hypothetical protein VH853_00640 [Polyangia bacterium]|nr:hypothetical protein [Polyangia bacterium]
MRAVSAPLALVLQLLRVDLVFGWVGVDVRSARRGIVVIANEQQATGSGDLVDELSVQGLVTEPHRVEA